MQFLLTTYTHVKWLLSCCYWFKHWTTYRQICKLSNCKTGRCRHRRIRHQLAVNQLKILFCWALGELYHGFAPILHCDCSLSWLNPLDSLQSPIVNAPSAGWIHWIRSNPPLWMLPQLAGSTGFAPIPHCECSLSWLDPLDLLQSPIVNAQQPNMRWYSACKILIHPGGILKNKCISIPILEGRKFA
jgi:hypothetical protein